MKPVVKNLIAVALVALLAAMVLPVSALVVSPVENPVAFSLSTETPELEGTETTLQIRLDLDRNPGLTGIALDIVAPEGFTLTARTFDDAVTGGLDNGDTKGVSEQKPGKNPFRVILKNDTAYEPGTFDVVDVPNNPICTATGSLLTLTYTVDWSKVTPGQYVFSLQETGFGGGLAYMTRNGETDQDINVFYDGMADLAALTVTVKDSTILYGDVDGDGTVNSDDCDALNHYIAEWKNISINKDNADLDLNGVINADDCDILTHHVAEWNGYKILPYVK